MNYVFNPINFNYKIKTVKKKVEIKKWTIQEGKSKTTYFFEDNE